jgi:hypothetical protein
LCDGSAWRARISRPAASRKNRSDSVIGTSASDAARSSNPPSGAALDQVARGGDTQNTAASAAKTSARVSGTRSPSGNDVFDAPTNRRPVKRSRSSLRPPAGVSGTSK